MFKGLSNIGSLLKTAQEAGGKMQEINAQLKTQRVTGSAGAGMVEVEANGLGEILRVTIDPSLFEKNEREMVEDLVPAATNEAIQKAKQLHVEAMQSITSGINLPGLDLDSALKQFTGGADVPKTDS